MRTSDFFRLRVGDKVTFYKTDRCGAERKHTRVIKRFPTVFSVQVYWELELTTIPLKDLD